MNEVVEESFATVVQPSRSGSTLFVASSLDTWATHQPNWIARDFQINDTMYRRLDPEYYAWLRSRMVVAKKAATAGHLHVAAFEDLRVRFNAVHEWAVQHFGESQLVVAVREFRSGDYRPPVAEDETIHTPAPRAYKSAAADISPLAMALVDSISEHALSLGWKRERLYRVGPERGLVSFLKPGDQIGKVTAQSIEIIHPPPSGVRHRFYNPDVEQLWIAKKEK